MFKKINPLGIFKTVTSGSGDLDGTNHIFKQAFFFFYIYNKKYWY